MANDDGDLRQQDLIAELGAYMDREAAPEELRATEARLFQDREALALLQALRADQEQLRSDLDRANGSVPPERLLETIQDGFESRREAAPGGSGVSRGLPSRGWMLAAASLAFLVIGAGSGVWWAETRVSEALHRFEARSEVERGVIASTVSHALETQVSGESVDWESGEVSGRVVPLRTYRSQSGHWCREYERTTRFEAGTISVLALACRTGDGQWVTIRAEPRSGMSPADEL